MKNKAEIIFWGTPEFAVGALEALILNKFNVVAVVTNPDEPVGRKQILTSPPVKILAKKHKIPVFQPENLKDENFKKELPEAELYIVAAYGKIIPKNILEMPEYGALNIHPSLLPRWRGPSPIQYTILNGDEKAGVTLMKMDERMDHGPILAVKLLKSDFNSSLLKSDFRTLHDKLTKLGAELLIEALPKYLNGEITPMSQDDAKATYSKILKKDDGRIDWSRKAVELERMVRALNPWPGTWTIWPTGDKIYRIRIEEADFTDEEPALGSPGYVWQDNKPRTLSEQEKVDAKRSSEKVRGKNPLFVKTGGGSLIIKSLTLAGKKPLSAESFIKGYPQFIRTTLV